MEFDQKPITRRTISLLLAFVLCASLTAMILLGQIGLGICSNKNVIEARNSSRYAEESYKKFQTKYTGILEQNQLPTELAEKSFSQEQFYEDFRNSEKDALEDGKGKVIGAGETKQLSKEVSKYLSGKGSKLNENEKAAIEDISQEVSSYYEKYATFKFGEVFYQFRTKIMDGMTWYVPLLIAIAIIAVGLLWWLNRKTRGTIKYVVMSIGGAMLSGLTIYLLTDFKDSILPTGNVGAEYYNKFITELSQFTLPPLIFSLAVGAVISVILILVGRHGK